ncbi:hypothetical protein [Streptomyces sp. MMG1121]|uniref:hypothetical protein n=1 Tax=Streptomyces sp. MMG1121 TaxID=1415544 RepID=UPI0006AF7F2F|nr:hypothetical protein [Streptomyces sp. MMG1121]KOV64009.1 hypothetical protein ADK64_17850 [Streptomyces sp. MMG1121]
MGRSGWGPRVTAPGTFNAFIAYGSHDHRHSGIGWHTPVSVRFGTGEAVRGQRAVPLAEASARRPRPPESRTAWVDDLAGRREPASAPGAKDGPWHGD